MFIMCLSVICIFEALVFLNRRRVVHKSLNHSTELSFDNSVRFSREI